MLVTFFFEFSIMKLLWEVWNAGLCCVCQHWLVAVATSLLDSLWWTPSRCHKSCITDTRPSLDLCYIIVVQQCHHLCKQHRVGAAYPRSAFCWPRPWAYWSHFTSVLLFFGWRLVINYVCDAHVCVCEFEIVCYDPVAVKYNPTSFSFRR